MIANANEPATLAEELATTGITRLPPLVGAKPCGTCKRRLPPGLAGCAGTTTTAMSAPNAIGSWSRMS